MTGTFRGAGHLTELNMRILSLLGLTLVLVACSTASTATPTPINTPEPTPTPAPTPHGAGAWWNDTVFYEIFVRSFYDSNGDGVGDLKGITAKLDYLTELGIKGIWLMPIHPSPSYHGYDVTDYRAVNPDYGTLDDFKQLLNEAHKRGIRVIIDFVLNHTSSEHPWFVASRDPKSDQRNWYVWSDTDPGYLGPWGQTVWHKDSSGYYFGIFWEGMPDLNYRTPAVTQEMHAVTRYWLSEIGVDGLRLDGARHLIENKTVQINTKETHDWFGEFFKFYKSIKPDAMTVGEVWDGSINAAPYVQDNQMDLVFNFDMSSAYLTAVRNRYATVLNNEMARILKYYPIGQYGSFLTNHDMDRVMNQFSNDTGKAKAAAALYLTMPGVPFIYYGEEIGMNGAKPDEEIRTPMQWSSATNAGFSTHAPWEPVNGDYTAKNVAAQAKDTASLLTLYRKLVALRNEHAALRTGDLLRVESGATPVFAALRALGDEVILVLVNLSDAAVKEYGLSAASSPLKGALTPQVLLGDGAFAPLTVDAQGGFSDYKPLAELPAGAIVVVRFPKSVSQ